MRVLVKTKREEKRQKTWRLYDRAR